MATKRLMRLVKDEFLRSDPASNGASSISSGTRSWQPGNDHQDSWQTQRPMNDHQDSWQTQRPMGSNHGASSSKRGEWTCPNCGNNVWAEKDVCGRCHTLRPPDGVGGVAHGAFASSSSAGIAAALAQREGVGKGGRRLAPGVVQGNALLQLVKAGQGDGEWQGGSPTPVTPSVAKVWELEATQASGSRDRREERSDVGGRNLLHLLENQAPWRDPEPNDVEGQRLWKLFKKKVKVSDQADGGWLRVLLSCQSLEDTHLVVLARFLEDMLLQHEANTTSSSPLWCSLELDQNSFSDEGLVAVLDVLEERRVNCKMIKLYRNNLTDVGGERLAGALLRQVYPADEIHLSHNAFTARTLVAMCMAMKLSESYPIMVANQKFAPCWLRIERNSIDRPLEVVELLQREADVHICLAQTRNECGSSRCEHASWRWEEAPLVHVFMIQKQNGNPSPVSNEDLREGVNYWRASTLSSSAPPRDVGRQIANDSFSRDVLEVWKRGDEAASPRPAETDRLAGAFSWPASPAGGSVLSTTPPVARSSWINEARVPGLQRQLSEPLSERSVEPAAVPNAAAKAPAANPNAATFLAVKPLASSAGQRDRDYLLAAHAAKVAGDALAAASERRRAAAEAEAQEASELVRKGQKETALEIVTAFLPPDDPEILNHWREHIEAAQEPEAEANRILRMMKSLHGMGYNHRTAPPRGQSPPPSGNVDFLSRALDVPGGNGPSAAQPRLDHIIGLGAVDSRASSKDAPAVSGGSKDEAEAAKGRDAGDQEKLLGLLHQLQNSPSAPNWAPDAAPKARSEQPAEAEAAPGQGQAEALPAFGVGEDGGGEKKKKGKNKIGGPAG